MDEISTEEEMEEEKIEDKSEDEIDEELPSFLLYLVISNNNHHLCFVSCIQCNLRINNFS